MKKCLCYLTFLFFVPFFLFAQDAAKNQERLKKYWYYRNRLLNNYILVGDCDGCSIPAGIRGYFSIGDNPSQTLKWSDATIELGWYIGVLATEFKLLTDNSQFVAAAATVQELYYALKAFNRLDETAEAYMRCNVNSGGNVAAYNNCVNAGITPQAGDLNGFFIRDDVPSNFISNNSSHFNQGTNSTLLTNAITTVSSDKTERADGNPPGQNPGNADLSPVEESVDQVLAIMMGCALVNKFVPSGNVYNGMDIRQEARDIVDRMVNWIKFSFEVNFGIPTPIGTLSINYDYDIIRWIAVNPVNHEICKN